MNKKLKRLEIGYAREDYNQENRGFTQAVGTPEGRQALWWLLGQCGTFTNSFDPDPHVAAFNAGKQWVGQTLLARLEKADDRAFINALGENHERTTARDAARRSAADDGDDDGGYARDPDFADR